MTARRAAEAGMLVIFLMACCWLAVRAPNGVSASADPGAQAVPIWLWLIPVLLALGMVRAFPPRFQKASAHVIDKVQVRRELVVLFGCAVAFPVLNGLPVGSAGESYVLIKVVVLLLIPGVSLAVWRRRRGRASVAIEQPPSVGAWPLIPVVLYLLLFQFGPFAPGAPSVWPDPVTLIVAATATALTAGVGEEIFYRFWLQTRLEAVGGPFFGVLAASLLFALMHLGSHGESLTWDLRLVAVIAQQGTFGLLCGYLWSRYRRLWAPILIHVLNNGLLVIMHLLGW